MDRRWRIRVEEIDRHGAIVARVDRTRDVTDSNPQHVLGAMLGDVIVAMAPDDAADVLQQVILRLDVLEDESLRPFCKLALLWLVWRTRGGDAEFGDFVTVEERQ